MKITDVNCYFHYIISKIHTFNMTLLLILAFITPGSVCPIYSILFPPIPFLFKLEEVIRQSLSLRIGELRSTCLRAEHLHKLLRILLHGRFLISALIYLFSYLFISVWTQGYIFFKDLFIYLFIREGKGGRKIGREILMCGCLS